MEPLLYCTIGRMAALCPRSTLTYLSDKPRVSLRDALPSIPLSQEIRGSLLSIPRVLAGPIPSGFQGTRLNKAAGEEIFGRVHDYGIAFDDLSPNGNETM